jgi:hypothetical protein
MKKNKQQYKIAARRHKEKKIIIRKDQKKNCK